MESRKNGTDEPICRTGIETQIQRTDLWSQQGKERVGQIERAALKRDYHVYKRSPVVICCMMQGAQYGAL